MKDLPYRFVSNALVILGLWVSGVAQAERTIYVTVESTRKEFVRGLAAEHFRLTDEGNNVGITGFSSSTEPVSVGLLFDVSGSVLYAGSRDVNAAAASIYELVQAQHQNAEFFLLGFNKEFQLLADWTIDAEEIGRGLSRLPTLQSSNKNNVTSLHATCLDALAKVQKGKFRKKALIVFSDGLDTAEDVPLKEVIRTVQGDDTLVYVVNISEPAPTYYGSSAKSGLEFVDGVTASSGGKLFTAPSTLPENRARVFVKNPNTRIKDAFEAVFRDLDAQYALRFSPSKAENSNSARSLNVMVSIPSELKKNAGTITIRYRKKYRVEK